ncbi:RNA polymerase-associated factor [Dinochytrium kinnereticum]|nr:RNA polymerase-associated factor [Dinochytrium kinnereticum]
MNMKETFVNKKDLLDTKDQELLAPYREPVEGTEIQAARPLASWLRRSEVVPTDFSTVKSKVDPAARAQKIIQNSPPKKFANLQPRDRIIKTIENTFDVAAKAHVSTLKHPTNPNLTAAEILPVYPDFENWANRYRLVMYDGDPMQNDKSKDEDDDNVNIPLEEAIIKPLKNPKDPDDTFIAYYAPTPESVQKIRTKRLLFDEDDEEVMNASYEYAHVRDFSFKQKAADAENPMIFIEIREDEGAAFYTPLGDRMILTKKRAVSKVSRRGYDEEEWEKATHYNLSFRAFSKAEKRKRRTKLREVLLRREMEEADDGDDGVDDEDEDPTQADLDARNGGRRKDDGGRDERAFADVTASQQAAADKSDKSDDEFDDLEQELEVALRAEEKGPGKKRSSRAIESDSDSDSDSDGGGEAGDEKRRKIVEDEDGDIRWEED